VALAKYTSTFDMPSEPSGFQRDKGVPVDLMVQFAYFVYSEKLVGIVK